MKRIRFVLLLVLLGLLGGCSGLNTEDLYCLPEATEDYYDLQEALSGVISEGLTYHAPASGARQEPVQLVDLNGDGVDEAVAFFRSATDGTVKTYIFSKDGDVYRTAAVIDCSGSAIGSVEYADLDGSGDLELLISCQVSEAVTQALQVCRYVDGEAFTLLTIPCGRYVLTDLDSDNAAELFCLTGSGADAATVEYYSYRDGQLQLGPERRLSSSFDSILSVQHGVLTDGSKAVLVSSSLGDSQIVSDVFALVDETLDAVAPEADLLISDQLRGGVLYPQDIDGDGQTEIPKVIGLKPYDEGATAQSIVAWYGVDRLGGSEEKLLTYHDLGGHWYLQLPEAWEGQITVKEGDIATPVSTVNTVSFYRLTETGASGEEILTIYTLKGAAKQDYAEEQGLTILSSDTEVLLAVSLNADAAPWEGTVSMAQVSDWFHFDGAE